MRIFKETQRFNQWWLQLINIGLIILLLFLLYTWFVAKDAVDKVSANDTTGQIIVIASIVPVLILIFTLKLKTSIDEVGIHYQFFPFHLSKKTIRWNDIEKCYVRTYSPIKEYGGWGYKTSFGERGKALNVRGDKGVQIEFKTGEKLLIGTQKEAEASQVITRNFNNLT